MELSVIQFISFLWSSVALNSFSCLEQVYHLCSFDSNTPSSLTQILSYSSTLPKKLDGANLKNAQKCPSLYPVDVASIYWAIFYL